MAEDRVSEPTAIGEVMGGRKLRAWPPMGEDVAPGIEFRRIRTGANSYARTKLHRESQLVPAIVDLRAFYRNCNTSAARPFVEGECMCCRGAGFVQCKGRVMGCPVCHGSGQR